MGRILLSVICLVCFSGFAASTHYDNTYTECWEQTLCHEPGDYPLVDYIDEISIRDKESGASWNGTIEIRNVSFNHNFTPRVENGRFETIDKDSGRDKAGDTRAVFDGVMQVGSMCNEPVFDVDVVKSSKYTINIYGNDTYGVRSCTEQPVRVDYTLTLDTYTQDMEAVVKHNNVTKSFQTDNYHGLPRGPGTIQDEAGEDREREEIDDGEEVQQESGGLLDGLISIFSGFF